MRPVLFIAATIILGLYAAPSFAAPKWTVDASSSHLQFSGTDSGKDFSGEFKTFNAEISFDAKDLESSRIKVTVDTSSAVTGDKNYDGNLPTSEWFNIKAFPNAIFESTAIKYVGADKDGIENYEAAGKLTMIGVTKDILLGFSLKADSTQTRAFGGVTLKRLDFGLGKAVDPSGGTVSNDIAVKFDITAHQ